MKYSVIVPVYHAEKTLRRCVDSLLREQYSDAEIILVNDGSKDKSGEICRDYAQHHPNVRALEKENGGVSTARNAGLDAAVGEYVVFVDSDDYAASDFFAVLDAALKKNKADLWMFSCCVDDGKNKKIILREPFEANDRVRLAPAIVNAVCKKTLNPPWAKLYRRDIIEDNHIRFPVGASVAEDRAFNIKYSFYIQSFSVSDRILYTVSTENENSLTRGRQKNLNEQFAITRQYFEDALKEAPISDCEKEQYRRAVNFGDCRYIYHEAKLMLADQVGWAERQRKLGRRCDEINRKHMKYPRTRYCALISLPVRLRLTFVIDAIARKLSR